MPLPTEIAFGVIGGVVLIGLIAWAFMPEDIEPPEEFPEREIRRVRAGSTEINLKRGES